MRKRALILHSPPPLAGLILALLVATVPLVAAQIYLPTLSVARSLGRMTERVAIYGSDLPSRSTADALLLAHQTISLWSRTWESSMVSDAVAKALSRNKVAVGELTTTMSDNFMLKKEVLSESIELGAKASSLTALTISGQMVNQAQMSTALVAGPASNWWRSVGSSLSDGWNYFLESVKYYSGVIINNWKQFLRKEDVAMPPRPTYSSQSAIMTELDKERLKQEIESSIRQDLNKILEQTNINPYGTPQGMIVVPSSGDSRRDAAFRAQVAKSFSDEVRLEFDPGGQTGVVTPIFKERVGNDYLFILTPVQ